MSEEYIKSLVQKSKKAQEVLETYSQEQVDAIVRRFARIVFDEAEPLARMAADETRMGVYEDKVKKNQGKARIIWNSLKGKKSVGVLRRIPEEGIIEVAKPMGVVGAVTPCTNPIVTPMCNAMFAVKGRNSIIVSPHPRGKKCATRVAELYRQALKELGAPEDVVQVIEEPTVELTNLLMKAVDVVIATGGMGMVRAAYSSGKPSFGVGAGNVQCIIDEGMDSGEVAEKVIDGRCFDNGIICSGEQTIIVNEKEYDQVLQAFVDKGAAYFDDPQTVEKFRSALFQNDIMNKDVVGQSVAAIAAISGVAVPEGTRVIILKADDYGERDLLSKEKMCPVISAYPCRDFAHGVEIAYANLKVEGMGHSVSIHSNNQQNLEYAGNRLPVSRLLVNQICSTMNGGAFVNGLSPTTTLGCGSWGNNSISENLSYRHLFNVSRIATVIPGKTQPSDEEIWG